MNKQITRSVNRLNTRLDLPVTYATRRGKAFTMNVGHLHAGLATCYGGYRLNQTANSGGGITGFANNNGMEARMSCKEFRTYLKGIHDVLDHLERTA